MSLLYVKEHTTCYNYEVGYNPVVEKKIFQRDYEWNFSTSDNKIIFVLAGALVISYGLHKNKKLSQGQMVLLPAEVDVVATIVEDNTVIYNLSIRNPKNLCECFSLDMLLKEDDEASNEGEIFLLDADPKIVTFFQQWDTFVSDGLLCKYYLSLKIKELFYYLRAYHTKETLLLFFYPILSNDLRFSDFVMKNHTKVKTVQELADLANYSLSGFQKRFRKVFGMSAYNWMRTKKLKAIFHDITNTNQTFKEISSKFDFSSPSHFNDYCKENFGYTPGIIRREKINLNIDK